MTEVDTADVVDAAPARECYRLQEQVGFLLRRAHQRHVAIFAAAITDLTPPQFAALAKLGELGVCSQNHLGQLVAMDAATIKGVVDRLKARGLVALASDEGDRRRLIVSLTGEGRAALAEVIPKAGGITTETLSPLTPKEAETVVRLLVKLG